MHIGDGDEMELLKDLVLSCRLSNLLVDLPGYKLINELIDLLENNEYDAFINFSLSEGLPVTLMMAISAGIPLIATDAGGTKEIVTKETGFLLPLSFRQIEFSEAIMKCLKNQKLRESSLSFFQNNFSASKNYRDFYQKL
jgi:glycosyltransferase involved in cell wall biosynthesis